MKLKIEFANNECQRTIWTTETILIARRNPAREHYKNAYFLLRQFDPTWFMTNFLQHISTPDSRRFVMQHMRGSRTFCHSGSNFDSGTVSGQHRPASETPFKFRWPQDHPNLKFPFEKFRSQQTLKNYCNKKMNAN